MEEDFKHVFCNDHNVCEACPYMEECFDQVLKELECESRK